jgi:hypothetical protein
MRRWALGIGLGRLLLAALLVAERWQADYLEAPA